MVSPVLLGAVDVGSNAMRLLVAEASPGGAFRRLDSRRAAVRLGTSAFGQGALDRATVDRAVETLRRFKRVMDRRGALRYRAVATSAARNARNRDALVDRVRREADVELEIIEGQEEARLVRTAVLGAMARRPCPRLIADLGGGSLEISLLAERELERSVVVRAGTVRLLQTTGGPGPLEERPRRVLSSRVRGLLRRAFHRPPDVGRRTVVACGGNAETLARLAPGPGDQGRALDLQRLATLVPRINAMDVKERVEEYGVRRERAEVMGIAALVLVELGEFLGFRRMEVPGVGVREGIVRDLAHLHFGPDAIDPEAARSLMVEARALGRRLRYDRDHADRVQATAGLLFDRLAALHRLPVSSRLTLELAAQLHDVGKAVARKGHGLHGEYIVRNAEIAGLEPRRRAALACLVRSHNHQGGPDPADAPCDALDDRGREEVRHLAALLRLADGLDRGRSEPLDGVTVRLAPGRATFEIAAPDGAAEAIEGARRRAALFERVYGRKAVFRNGGG